jgi:hypothetical protein
MGSLLPLFTFLLLVSSAALSAQAQMCGLWTVTVDVSDEKGVPVDKAWVAFTDLAEDDIANRRPLKKDDSSAGRFIATFVEGDRVQAEYNLLIKAAGHQGRTTSINISYCRSTSHVIGLNSNKSTLENKVFHLTGVVHDPYGAVVPGAVIEAKDKFSLVTKTTTDAEGKYRLDLYSGEYSISVTARGFKKLENREFRFIDSAAEKTTANFLIEGSTDHEPCGYGGDQCSDNEIPKDIVTGPSLVNTILVPRPVPKSPWKKKPL